MAILYSTGIAHVDSDPNLIEELQDAAIQVRVAVHTTTGAVWRFVPANQVGAKWVPLTASPSVIGQMVCQITGFAGSNVQANTLDDVPDSGILLLANKQYYIRYTVPYTSSSTSNGSRWSIGSSSSPTLLQYQSCYPLSATALTANYGLDYYDQPANSNATSPLSSGIARVEGMVTLQSDGILMLRFASKLSNPQYIVAHQGLVEYMRLT
jgi:hypothetical protein